MDSTSAPFNKTGSFPVLHRLDAMRAVPDGIAAIDDDARGPSATAIRARAIAEAGAVGSMEDGSAPAVSVTLLDKLGGRLAFERSGVRLYDAILRKAEQDPLVAECVPDLAHIREEELQHVLLLAEVITALGGDPTLETPCADLEGVMSSGLLAVVNDPRTRVADALHAALIAELADVDAWTSLAVHGAPYLGDEQIRAFREAEQHEQEHLRMIRQWHAKFESAQFVAERRPQPA